MECLFINYTLNFFHLRLFTSSKSSFFCPTRIKLSFLRFSVISGSCFPPNGVTDPIGHLIPCKSIFFSTICFSIWFTNCYFMIFFIKDFWPSFTFILFFRLVSSIKGFNSFFGSFTIISGFYIGKSAFRASLGLILGLKKS